MPGRKRVAVLLDFLGQQAAAILKRDHLVRSHNIRTEPEVAGLSCGAVSENFPM
jgi:hypothetical protein